MIRLAWFAAGVVAGVLAAAVAVVTIALNAGGDGPGLTAEHRQLLDELPDA